MVQQRVSYSGEAALRFGIVSDDRFATDIAGCGHQWTAEFRQQKMMQRTVGQEHAQLCKVWRYRRAERTICASARQHDWARGIQAAPRFCFAQDRVPAHRVEAISPRLWTHDRERLMRSMLPRAQPHDGFVVERIAHQMVTAHAFDGDDAAATQARNGDFQCFFASDECATVAVKGELRPTLRTGERLGVKAPIERVLVLPSALRAKLKAGHGRIWPVVRQRRDDRIARSALRTIRERIAKATFGRVLQFFDAVVTTEQIRRQMHVGALGYIAGEDAKIERAFDDSLVRRHNMRLRQRRCLSRQRSFKPDDIR